MKKLLFILTLFSAFSCSAATILNPMDFDGSEAQKQQVIDSITATVRKDYCEKNRHVPGKHSSHDGKEES
ncbi:hypothetical protein [Pseudomonas sp. MD195_PC81_125]|uniref:hypothetical protein n=1 Tax=Pseudomonas sp. MD195_PC81_125 TaxID=2741560 RepID=UPI001C715331|nr:hypothetical protein [Pseudomonas sp. MD195_PC81_125]